MSDENEQESASVTWSPAEFLSGDGDAPVGRLAQTCLDNPSVRLPDGTTIERDESGFTIVNRNGKEVARYEDTSERGARTTAASVLDLSAQSRHPESVGGHRRFASLNKMREGKSLDKRPGQGV